MPDSTPIHTIITHPGSSHKDEFLACAVLLHYYPVEIIRKEPSPEELSDSRIAVLDIGHQHEPEHSNFDHHQFPGDHVPTCSLSLVLQHLGLYEDAHRFCEWLEPLEWFDSKGAIATSRWLDISYDAIRKLNSPIDVTLLKWFSSANHWIPGDPLWVVMQKIGSDLVRYLNTMHARMEFISQHHQIWECHSGKETYRVLFMPRTDPLPADPSLGLGLFMDQHSTQLHGLIYPDSRGQGYGLSRYNDFPGLDFNRISAESDVHFSHARGFLAKTSATDQNRLRQLFALAIVSG